MKYYPYFKCNFCKVCNTKRFLACAAKNLDSFRVGGGKLCNYGTGFSLYKWFPRILAGCGLVLLAAFYVFCFCFLRTHGVQATDPSTCLATIFVVAVPLGLVIVVIIPGWLYLHEKFHCVGGKVFGKEK